MKNLLIISVVMVIAFASCEKKVRTTVVSGKVINAFSKQPIDSVLVTLLDGVSTAGEIIPGNTTSGIKNAAYTDKEGRFRVEITGEYLPFLAFAKENYEAPNGGLIQSVTLGAKITDYECRMKAYARFNPVIVPVENVTFLKFCPAYYSNNRLDFECESGWERPLGNSPNQPYSVPFLTFGDTYQTYKITYRRNDILYTKIDSVFLKPFETYTDTIYF